VKSLWTGPSHHDVISAKSQCENNCSSFLSEHLAGAHEQDLVLKLSHCGLDQQSSWAGFGQATGCGPILLTSDLVQCGTQNVIIIIRNNL